jgi:hypothetical protein
MVAVSIAICTSGVPVSEGFLPYLRMSSFFCSDVSGMVSPYKYDCPKIFYAKL